jgi:hypothetical protein
MRNVKKPEDEISSNFVYLMAAVAELVKHLIGIIISGN